MNVGKSASLYLTANDIVEPTTIVVERVVEKTFNKNGREEKKIVVYYEGEPRGAPLSMPQLKQLIAIFRSDETNDWVGRKVEMYRDDDIFFDGKQVSGIRFRALSPS